jgi:hypothetical protein
MEKFLIKARVDCPPPDTRQLLREKDALIRRLTDKLKVMESNVTGLAEERHFLIGLLAKLILIVNRRRQSTTTHTTRQRRLFGSHNDEDEDHDHDHDDISSDVDDDDACLFDNNADFDNMDGNDNIYKPANCCSDPNNNSAELSNVKFLNECFKAYLQEKIESAK